MKRLDLPSTVEGQPTLTGIWRVIPTVSHTSNHARNLLQKPRRRKEEGIDNDGAKVTAKRGRKKR